MLGYVMLGTNDFDKSVAFYETLLGEMGAKRILEGDSFVAWGVDPNQAGLEVCKPHDGKPATVGNGTMAAIACDKPETVDKLYEKAISLGATDEGAAGPRGEKFYAGYFRDLDGNKLNFFCIPG